MLHTLWSVKGGSGVTVVAAALGAALAERSGRAVVVDLCGDQLAALGLAEPAAPGVTDWLASPEGGARSLARLSVPVDDRLAVLPRGGAFDWPEDGAAQLIAALDALPCPVVVDAGVRPIDPSAAGHLHRELCRSGSSVLVTRACYLSLRRAAALDTEPDAVVLVREVGRSLERADVQAALRRPVLATVDWDPSIARAVDAGLLGRRVPRRLTRSLRGLLTAGQVAA